MSGRRGFGEIERRTQKQGTVFRARYTVADGNRYSRTFSTKLDAEGWLRNERALLDRDEWSPPKVRRHAEAQREARAAYETVGRFAKRYLDERGLRPNTLRGYESLLRTKILPWFEEMPLSSVTLSEIKEWRAELDPKTASTNAAAYRLLRSILQAAEEEELIDRAPPKIRGASTARTRHVTVPATFEQLAVITDAMPPRLRLFVTLAAFVGLRQGELLELRRSDVDLARGQISVTRKVDKDVRWTAPEACRNCGRPISAPKTRSGVRVVHVPPPFLPALENHLAEHAAPGKDGLLFPGDRTDHMSVRYLMDRFVPAREAADRPDLTIHDLRHTALTLAGQHGATAAELQLRGGHSSQAAMVIYQHATAARDHALAEKIGETFQAWAEDNTT